MPYKDKDSNRRYQKRWSSERRNKWLFENGPCTKCGSRENLEMDHVDPKTKDPHIKNTSHCVWFWSDERLKLELEKCQVLCRECHKHKTRIETYGERSHGTYTMYHRMGCRCDDCRSACNRYHREYKIRIKLGSGRVARPQPLKLVTVVRIDAP